MADAPETGSGFGGDEATNVMDRPPPVEDPADDANPDKAYVAPRTVPRAAMPDAAEPDSPKIVLNLPEAPVPADTRQVAAARARRRAPTVKLARGTLAAQAAANAAEESDADREDELPLAPTLLEIPIDTAEMDRLAAAEGLGPVASSGHVEAVAPIADAPQRSSLPRLGSPRLGEAPATALHVADASGAERSRLPWIVGGVLLLGAAAAAVWFFIGAGASSAPPAATSVAATATAAQTSEVAATTATAVAVAPEPTASETAEVEPTASALVLNSATASTTPPVTVGATPATHPTTPAPTSTWRPPPTAGGVKTGAGAKRAGDYIPSGI